MKMNEHSDNVVDFCPTCMYIRRLINVFTVDNLFLSAMYFYEVYNYAKIEYSNIWTILPLIGYLIPYLVLYTYPTYSNRVQFSAEKVELC